MEFKKRRINYKNPTKTKKKWEVGIIGILIVAIILLGYGVKALVQNIGFINIVGLFGETLQVDSYGNTNIMLVGVGGEGHDGEDLTDTLIVASINEENGEAKMLSIPRDFFVDINEIGGGVRINRVYELGKKQFTSEQGMLLLKRTLEHISNTKIDYYVKVNFKAFKDIVDALGGIDIYVDEAIYDTQYPLDGTIKYQTFSIDAGQQHIDGETALKYARSRKTSSDFDRSARQQKLLFAIKETALKQNILLDPGKIKAIMDAVSDNIETNLSLREIIELARIGHDFELSSISPHVITDDPTRCGGFLYPPERELFGGAYVLLPIGNNYDFLHQYSDLIFHYPSTNDLQFQILNGTKTAGLAGETKAVLDRLCFNTIRFGNARNQEIEKTMIYYKQTFNEEGEPEDPPETLQFITQIIRGEVSTEIPEKYFEEQYLSDANIIIELGEDYASNRPENIFYLYYPVDNGTSSDEEEEGEAEAAEVSE